MNPRTTLLLTVVAALLGAFIWIHEIEGEARRQSEQDDAKRIHPGLESREIEALAFTTQDGVDARFERRDGRWTLVAPREARADPTALDAIAGALVSLPREGRVEEPGDLEQYGLGDEARVVRFEVAGETKGLRIGRKTPVGGHRYVTRLGDDEVAYVATYRLNALDRSLVELRDRRIFGFEVGDVLGLRIAWPEGAVELERDARGDWQMKAPIAGPADATTIRELLSDLSFLRAQSFVDEPDEQVEAASREYALELRWTERGRGQAVGEDLPEETHQVRIGGRLGDGLLLSDSDGKLYTIAPERLEDFERNVTAYRDKTLSRFGIDLARRLELEFEGGSSDSKVITAVLGERGWSRLEEGADESVAPPLDSVAVADLVRTLAELRAVDVVAEEMGEAELASLGLAPARVRVRVEDRAESGPASLRLAEVELGRFDEERGIFARRTDRPTVYLLDPELAERLPLSGQQFEDGYSITGSPADQDPGEDADTGEDGDQGDRDQAWEGSAEPGFDEAFPAERP